MSAKVIDDTLQLLGNGYEPYKGQIEPYVYERLKCRKEKQARWFVRQTEKSLLFICLGCAQRCSLRNPDGFQTVLPLEGKGRVSVVAGTVPILSDEELLEKKSLLTIPEVMSVLRIKERKVRSLIDEGQLEAHEALPIRVYSISVQTYMDKRR